MRLMFRLSDAERLALLCTCTGILGIVIVITLCLVCPFCWINKKLSRRQEIEDENKQYYVRNSFELSFMDREAPPPPYDSTRRTSLTDLKSSAEFNRRLVSVNSISSGYSDTDSVAGIPLPLISDTEVPVLEIIENQSDPGSVSITLQFKRIIGEDNKIFPQLRVDLKEANDLQARAYGGRCNPYFILGLYDVKVFNKRKLRKSEPIPLYEFHSIVVRKSQNPVYNESFFFPLENRNLKKCVLKIEARDQDKLTNDTILGVVHFSLKEVASALSQEPSKELDVHLKLDDAQFNYGQILLGLCYLPTAERMTVTVLKASNLTQMNETDGAEFYVQAMAIYGGKIFEKRKTSSRPASPFPVFNEMLMFDIPFSKLDHIVLLLAVYSTIERVSRREEEGQPRVRRKDSCIGKVVIGASSRKNSLNHWNAVLSSPRRQVIQWHELR